MGHGEKITFGQEGDQSPDYKIPGDVVIVLQEKKHERFVRKKQDLLMEKTVTLREALCGASFPVTHLDGRVLMVKTSPGEVIKPNTIKCVQSEGMPNKTNRYSKGNLLIKFTVEMPAGLSDKDIAALAKVLPGPTANEPIPSDAEECYMRDFDQRAYSTERAHQDDSDDEGHGGGQSAQCVHQ
eukprot:NODE_5464_length_697_cov_52.559649_g5441_i0.p1 GENE.NODE_5464_length_697_cov_52.559649_g5441_i0~~NODE_5464_length_697_cov_52.559649_g5441_i0.p1  ORF type:complete len:205 (-),score=67.71 NODE_5464_length_697_cov_52.559649_g5441_i0:83-631(-)